jgi:hypothetical protein
MRRHLLIAILFFSSISPCSLHSETLDLTGAKELAAVEEVNAELVLQEKLKEYFPKINPTALQYALNGYYHMLQKNKIKTEKYITVVDFSKPSTQERLFVIDIERMKVVHSSLVAHGRNSGEIFATDFSNEQESYKSSLGFYLTGETYIGKNGFSLKLDGLENGYNTNARERGVVIHGADYVSYDFIEANGKLGRSQGCPALPMEKYQKIISTIKNGSLFFIYQPNYSYLRNSKLLQIEDYDCILDLLSI